MLNCIKNSNLNSFFQNGLKAIKRSDRSKIRVLNNSILVGSLDIDKSFKNLYPQSNRWDYLVIVNNNIEGYFIEIHPAFTSEVNVMLRKRDWLKINIINSYFKNINTKKYKIIWVSSGKTKILKNSREYKKLVKENLIPINSLEIR